MPPPADETFADMMYCSLIGYHSSYSARLSKLKRLEHAGGPVALKRAYSATDLKQVRMHACTVRDSARNIYMLEITI